MVIIVQLLHLYNSQQSVVFVGFLQIYIFSWKCLLKKINLKGEPPLDEKDHTESTNTSLVFYF